LELAIVSDIGGTHARFGLADLAGVTPVIASSETCLCADYPTLEAALTQYAQRQGLPHLPRGVAIAIAGPVVKGAARLTNASWAISEGGLRSLGFDTAVVMNDFGAVALGTPCLGDADAGLVGPPAFAAPGKPVAVLGAGTGFGAAILVPGVTGDTLIETEGGHIAFAPVDALEVEIWGVLQRRFGRVSIERILSGPGLVNLYQALAQVRGEAASCTTAASITEAAARTDALAEETLDRFCAVLGSTAGDFALAYGAQGGVYVAGGIAPRLFDRLRTSLFRERFEAKGRFQGYVSAIPSRVVLHPYVALLGAARALQRLSV
jgi:glucokinase